MSRTGDYDGDDYFMNQYEFWQQSFKRARDSKRGLAALHDVRAALLALPEKRLIARALCTVGKADDDSLGLDPYGERADLISEQGEGVCVVGALAWHKRVQSGMTPEEAFTSLPFAPDYDDPSITISVGQEAGLRKTLGWWLMDLNDERLDHLTPEDRYTAVLAFLDEQIAKHPHTQNAAAV